MTTDTKPKRVLVVEGDENLLATIRLVLETVFEGVDVTTARDGATGWSLAEADDYHVVIADEHSAGLGGRDLLERIRSRSEATKRVLLLAPFSDPVDSAGDDPLVLEKPLDAGDFLDGIGRLLAIASEEE